MEGKHADARVGQRIGDAAMVTVEDFSRLVSGIYAAAVTPQHWESAIREFIVTLDGTRASALLIARRVELIWRHATVSAGSRQELRGALLAVSIMCLPPSRRVRSVRCGPGRS